jgi:multidrug efflux pump
MVAFMKLPVAPLPHVDFPTIQVTAQMPGASPETMAETVATVLERDLGIIADVTEMTSQSVLGQSQITLLEPQYRRCRARRRGSDPSCPGRFAD